MRLKYRLLSLTTSEEVKLRTDFSLQKQNTYYRTLSAERKELFVIRTIHFLENTWFESEESFELTDEVMCLVASAFVQITFGLRTDSLDHFFNIFIAPRSYAYRRSKQLYKGDVNPKTGVVTLSWPAVQEGFRIEDDGVNLCIHEFGHALFIEHSFMSEGGVFNHVAMEEWKHSSTHWINKIRKGDQDVLREYGGTDIMELFSVCLETFFEKPDRLATQEPEIFDSMRRILNQDPRNSADPLFV